jgi:hypothetical protein
MKRAGIAIVLLWSAGACFLSIGCFSYTKESTPVAVEPASPAQSSTTTTTTDQNGVVEKRTTSTYTNP